MKNKECFCCGESYLTYKEKSKYCSRACYDTSRVGVARSEEVRRKISLSHFGIKHSDDTKKKISLLKKGKTSAFKGRKHSKLAIEKNRIAHLGRKGSLSGNWRGGIYPENLRQRAEFRRTIQKQVLQRDNYTCQICGERGGALQVDHIQPWSEYIYLRFNIDNCRTLCVKCHYKITFGKPMPPTVRAWGQNMFKGENLQ